MSTRIQFTIPEIREPMTATLIEFNKKNQPKDESPKTVDPKQAEIEKIINEHDFEKYAPAVGELMEFLTGFKLDLPRGSSPLSGGDAIFYQDKTHIIKRYDSSDNTAILFGTTWVSSWRKMDTYRFATTEEIIAFMSECTDQQLTNMLGYFTEKE